MVKNMELLRELLQEESYEFRIMDDLGNLVEISHGTRKYFFSYTATPFNGEDVQKICADKFLTYQILKDKDLMPQTRRYLRPDLDPSWHDVIEFSSNEEIVADMVRHFKAPFIVKMNNGSLSRNVFKSKSSKGAYNALEHIFKEDWASLAQVYVEIDKEFRVIVVNNKVEMAYLKGASEFYANDSSIYKDIVEFLKPLESSIYLAWAGLDVALDKTGRLWLFEINTRPSFVAAIRAGKSEEVKALYFKALKNLR